MQLLETLYKINSPSGKETPMQEFITAWLKANKIHYVVDKVGNILVTKGKAKEFPCIAAHIDEVHSTRPSDFVVMRADRTMFGFSPTMGRMCGIGADDKNGIWVALRLLDHVKNMKAVFFVGEERGCKGSNNVDLKFFDNCKYVIECDRQGKEDFIYSAMGLDLCTAKFMEDIKINDYGYKPAKGRMTDVVVLASRGIKLSVCNVSCGYYAEHTANEITRYNELLQCYKMVLHAVNTVGKTAAPLRSKKPTDIMTLSAKRNVPPAILGKMRGDYYRFIGEQAAKLKISDIEELSKHNPRLQRLWDYCKHNSPIGNFLPEKRNMTLKQAANSLYLRPYHVELMIEILFPQLNSEDKLWVPEKKIEKVEKSVA